MDPEHSRLRAPEPEGLPRAERAALILVLHVEGTARGDHRDVPEGGEAEPQGADRRRRPVGAGDSVQPVRYLSQIADAYFCSCNSFIVIFYA